MREVVVDARHELLLGRARINDAVAAAVVDDFVRAHARVAACIGQTSASVLARARQAKVDHLLAENARVAILAQASHVRRALAVSDALAAVLARRVEAGRRFERGPLHSASPLVRMPEQVLGATAHCEGQLARAMQVRVSLQARQLEELQAHL